MFCRYAADAIARYTEDLSSRHCALNGDDENQAHRRF
jgi:hypothetical protein